MAPRQKIAALLRATIWLPGLKAIFYHPAIRAALQRRPGFHLLYGAGWDLQHPFDFEHGTDTSGFVASQNLPSSLVDTVRKHVYGGSQPSIIRTALAELPPLENFTFVDLGCGKGRPLLVASEFPFRSLVGVELSAPLAADARKNAAILRQKFPARPAIQIETGDASAFPLPTGNLVVFLYNPFGAEVVAKVVTGMEAALAAEKRSLFVVYYNPVHGACFDASPALTRFFAATIPYAEEERGFGPDTEDPVVIWQTGNSAPARPGADARIVVTSPGTRIQLEGQPPA